MDERIQISGRFRPMIQSAVVRLQSEIESVNEQLKAALGSSHPIPKTSQEIGGRLKGLTDAMEPGSRSDADLNLPAWFGGALKTALVRERRQVATQVQLQRSRAVAPEVIAALEDRLAPFDELASQEWYSVARLLRIPRIDDFLSRGYLTRTPARLTNPEQPQKEFDPKSGVLFSARQLALDMPVVRAECEQRGVSLALLFLDLDRFKDLNSKYGEPVIDRDLLPPLMRAIEGTFFGHGSCYRHGGDEFVVLVPNGGQDVLSALMGHLTGTLAHCEYGEVIDRPTASGGVCELGPDSAVTDEEAISLAAKAKQVAKDAGRNQVMGVRVTDIGVSAPAPWFASNPA